jgi:hypothetical protein
MERFGTLRGSGCHALVAASTHQVQAESPLPGGGTIAIIPLTQE